MKKLLLVLALLLTSISVFSQTYNFKGMTINGFDPKVKQKGSITFNESTVVLDMGVKAMPEITMNIKERVDGKIIVFAPNDVTNYYIISENSVTLYAETKNEGVSFTQVIGYKLIK